MIGSAAPSSAALPLPRWSRGRARAFVVTVLVCLMVGRILDANPHPSYGYVPAVVLTHALPVWYAAGWRRDLWQRYGHGLLAVQAVLTFVPFLVFGHVWVGGVSGLLAGLVLLVIPGPIGWVFGAALAIAEELTWWAVGWPLTPTHIAVGWLLIAFVNTSLTLYGLSRLADLIDQLRHTEDALAAARIATIRLTAAGILDSEILNWLTAAADSLRAALRTDPIQGVALRRAGVAARAASAAVRQLALELPSTSSPVPVTTMMAPRVARLVNAAVICAFGLQYILNSTDPGVTTGPQPQVTILAVLACTVIVAVQLRHVRFEDPQQRPARWPLTLAAQALLCLALFPLTSVGTVLLLPFVVATCMIFLPDRSRWLPFALFVLAMPTLAWLRPNTDLSTLARQLQWTGYAVAVEVAACLLVYGLARLTQTSVALERTRHAHAEATAIAEVLRFAQDTHDTLGLGLSTIALKTDLAAALSERDPERARREAAQALHLTGSVRTDITKVATGTLILDLATELDTAVHSLTTAGIRVSVNAPDQPLGRIPEAASLAAVLREAVTNILRHSRARHCDIHLVRGPEVLTLSLYNDGVVLPSTIEPGQGVLNMAARLRTFDGTLHTDQDGDTFTVTAAIPIPTVSSLGQDAP